MYERRGLGLVEELGEGARLRLDARKVPRDLLPAPQVFLDAADASRLAEAHALAADAVDGIGEHFAAPRRHIRRKRVHAHALPPQVLEDLGVGSEDAVARADVD